ncbi:hypothetical protein Tco_0446224, partial [Tanacetum coccineum]
VYKATTEKLDWINPEGRQYPHDQGRRVIPFHHFINNDLEYLRVIPFHHFINNDLEYLRGGVSSRKYSTLVTKTTAADYLTKSDTYRSNLRRQDAYTPYSDPRGFIYENKDKKNRLMRIDELHKFSDGTLDDVQTALNDRLKGIRMEYLPQTFWSQRDKANARAMIQAIDKRLKTRRIMRSLERFVGGRPYGGDLRLLQRTI